MKMIIKRISAIILVTVLLMALVACGNKKQSEDETESISIGMLETDAEGVVEKYEEITLIEIPLEE